MHTRVVTINVFYITKKMKMFRITTTTTATTKSYTVSNEDVPDAVTFFTLRHTLNTMNLSFNKIISTKNLFFSVCQGTYQMVL